MSDKDIERYDAAAYAMQSGVAMSMHKDGTDCTPKHLRVGINSAHVTQAALTCLLLEKGIITEDELEKELADAMEREVALYERELGPNVKLG